MNKLKFVAPILSLVFPVISFAQPSSGACAAYSGFGTTICNVIDYVNEIINVLNPILFSLSFIVFFWGLTKFILNSNSQDEIQKGKNYMIWAVIALFILISFRAIITFISTDLGLGDSSLIPIIRQATP